MRVRRAPKVLVPSLPLKCVMGSCRGHRRHWGQPLLRWRVCACVFWGVGVGAVMGVGKTEQCSVPGEHHQHCLCRGMVGCWANAEKHASQVLKT